MQHTFPKEFLEQLTCYLDERSVSALAQTSRAHMKVVYFFAVDFLKWRKKPSLFDYMWAYKDIPYPETAFLTCQMAKVFFEAFPILVNPDEGTERILKRVHMGPLEAIFQYAEDFYNDLVETEPSRNFPMTCKRYMDHVAFKPFIRHARVECTDPILAHKYLMFAAWIMKMPEAMALFSVCSSDESMIRKHIELLTKSGNDPLKMDTIWISLSKVKSAQKSDPSGRACEFLLEKKWNSLNDNYKKQQSLFFKIWEPLENIVNCVNGTWFSPLENLHVWQFCTELMFTKEDRWLLGKLLTRNYHTADNLIQRGYASPKFIKKLLFEVWTIGEDLEYTLYDNIEAILASPFLRYCATDFFVNAKDDALDSSEWDKLDPLRKALSLHVCD